MLQAEGRTQMVENRLAKRRWTLKRVSMWGVCLLVGGLLAGELGARYVAGLGDPPLYVLDSEIEYLLVPNQKCRRFGHDYIVNKWSMRAGEISEHRVAGSSDYRVMVIGDSIVNGGAKIDQGELATTMLARVSLAKECGPHERMVVGNMSAGSWGPPNELAYVKRFGLFDADLLVIVLNSDDYDDVPGLEYIGSAWPRSKPTFALQELMGVYGWKAACKVLGRPAEPLPPVHGATHEEDVEQCRAAFVELVGLARSKGARVAVVQYLRKQEVTGAVRPGHEVISGWIKQVGVETYSTAEKFRSALGDGAADPFIAGDEVHASARGQKLLAGLFERIVEDAIRKEKEGELKGAVPAMPASGP